MAFAKNRFLIGFFILVTFSTILGASENKNYVILSNGESEKSIVQKAAHVVPSERQMTWQEMEFTAFVHFTINTFTDLEWGHGDEDPAIFNPVEFDANQWVQVCKNAGMRQIIVTAKHHDGFCLWPSQYTDHSVKSSPWKEGKGDIVGEVAEACQKAGLKFGVYLSPWDRHELTYGSETYNDYFINQLTELLSNYGEISEVWFDGACGEGPNGKTQVYDWKRYYALIRKLQPNAVIAVAGPDVRWVGTESGYGRETEWSVVPASQRNQEMIAENSQQAVEFVPQADMTSKDLGSREQIKKANMLVWYPSEVDVSIRPGWFYHASEDERVKSPEKLLDIYYSSVGRNSLLLLNLPPDRRGLIHENDARSLNEMRRILDATFSKNFADGAKIIASSQTEQNRAKYCIDGNKETYWAAEQGVDKASLEFKLGQNTVFDRLLLQEYIREGQRVEKFVLESWTADGWKEVTGGTTIGYKRLLRFPAVKSERVRLTILQSRANPTLAAFGLFKSPPDVTLEPASAAFIDKLDIKMASAESGTDIFYTVDGSEPDQSSKKYVQPFSLKNTSTIKACAIDKDGRKGLVRSARYNRAKYGITVKSPFSSKYPASGNLTLIDGEKGSLGFGDGKWQGYEGNDLDAIIDLGHAQEIKSINIRFIQDLKSWVFAPQSVKIEISNDGKDFVSLFEIENKISPDQDQPIIKKFGRTLKTTGRYIRVFAKNIGECPDWHQGAGGKAWLFSDEIEIN